MEILCLNIFLNCLIMVKRYSTRDLCIQVCEERGGKLPDYDLIEKLSKKMTDFDQSRIFGFE